MWYCLLLLDLSIFTLYNLTLGYYVHIGLKLLYDLGQLSHLNLSQVIIFI